MNPDLEGRLRSGEHLFGKSKSIPVGSESENYSEKIAGQRFKEIVNKVKLIYITKLIIIIIIYSTKKTTMVYEGRALKRAVPQKR